MASEQQLRPLTYGDVFHAEGQLKDEPITKEDAAMMEREETTTFGRTQKGGAASLMQSASDWNVNTGRLDHDAHSHAADQGMHVTQNELPGGGVLRTECIGDQPITAADSAARGAMRPVAGTGDAPEPFTVGEALEAAADLAGGTVVKGSDAQAIQSAERLATGQHVKGGVSASAQWAAAHNQQDPDAPRVLLSDVLKDARMDLPSDKYVSREDANKVKAAELRALPEGHDVKPGGVGESMEIAADLNQGILNQHL